MVDERQADFSLFLGNLAAGATLPAQQLKLSTDAPFCLREIAITGAGGQIIPSLTVKFQDARGAFVEQDFISSLQEIPYGGNDSVLTPIVPQIIYPPNGNIVFYVANTNPSVAVSSLRITFRGVGLYPQGSVLNRPNYPANFRELPYIYTQEITMSLTPLLDQIVNIQADSDFVFRAALIMQPGPNFNSFIGQDFQISFKDQNGKRYQNLGVVPGAVTFSAPFFDTIAGETTANRPGIFAPEIYLPANSSLYFDLYGPAGLLPLSFWIALIGSKVFLSNQP